MKAQQLRALLESNGLSQRGAARRLDIDERTMRRYVAGDQPVPQVVVFALRRLIAMEGKHVVGINELSDSELETFNDAVNFARAETWSRQQFIHCEPARDPAGKFCELRVYGDSNQRPLLAVIPIGANGKPRAAVVEP
jgi:transcriptional regulator with XRE-family HTH domain